ncbi:MAG: diacylglyceryl transferase [Cytophagales bacterium]|nr:diacylglyceryl transferase [Cytophagales bacterium]
MNRLKEKWGITSNLQFALILITFAVTGSTAAFMRRHLMEWLGLSIENIGPWVYYPLSFLLVFVFYQITLLINGTLLGQFKFFCAFEKKMLSRFGLKLGEEPKQ